MYEKRNIPGHYKKEGLYQSITDYETICYINTVNEFAFICKSIFTKYRNA